MGRVQVSVVVPQLASTAEALWYDTRRWPAFVDGLAHVSKLEEGWPEQAGARLLWDSKPGGRGRVIEQVLSYEPRGGQTVAVEDERMRGTQRVAFEPRDEGCRITLTLEYEIKQERGLKPVVDFLFVRRPMRDSLRRTLSRFRRELQADAEGW